MSGRRTRRNGLRHVELLSEDPLCPRAAPRFWMAASLTGLCAFYSVDSLTTWPTEVDWSRELVIVAERGECPSGGFTVSITALERMEGGDLRVSVAFSDPGPDDFVTLAMTFPRDVVVVSRKELAGITRLVFVDEDGGGLETGEVIL